MSIVQQPKGLVCISRLEWTFDWVAGICWSSRRRPATSSSFEEVGPGPWRLVVAERLLIQHVVVPSWYAGCNSPCVHSTVEGTTKHVVMLKITCWCPCTVCCSAATAPACVASAHNEPDMTCAWQPMNVTSGQQVRSSARCHLAHTCRATKRLEMSEHTSTYNSHKCIYVGWWHKKRMT